MPPGWAKLATKPRATGSLAVVKTIGSFRRQCCRRTGGGNDRYLSPDQIGRELGQAFIVVFCPAIFDDNILTLDKAHLVQAASEFAQEFRIKLLGCAIQEADDLWLCARDAWPRNGCHPDKGDKFASVHAAPMRTTPDLGA